MPPLHHDVHAIVELQCDFFIVSYTDFITDAMAVDSSSPLSPRMVSTFHIHVSLSSYSS
jgi:hypothetical protein